MNQNDTNDTKDTNIKNSKATKPDIEGNPKKVGINNIDTNDTNFNDKDHHSSTQIDSPSKNGNGININNINITLPKGGLSAQIGVRLPEKTWLWLASFAEANGITIATAARHILIAAYASGLDPELAKAPVVNVNFIGITNKNQAQALLSNESWKALEKQKLAIEREFVRLNKTEQPLETARIAGFIGELKEKYKLMAAEFVKKSGQPHQELFDYCDEVEGRLRE